MGGYLYVDISNFDCSKKLILYEPHNHPLVSK